MKIKFNIVLLCFVSLIFSQDVKTIVKKHSVRFLLSSKMVFSIIEAESNYKSKVVSKRNAIGLMQVVPKTAGIEAHKFLYGKERIPEDTILMKPEENIKYGCAYLAILRTRYFKNINNYNSRMYCIIAAYNTGASNVTKAFVQKSDTDSIENFSSLNKYQKSKIKLEIAIQKINKMDHDTVLSVMQENLPYQETVAYLNKVLNNMDKYSKI